MIDTTGAERRFWFMIPVADLTDAMMASADQDGILSVRRSLDGSLALLSYSAQSIPVIVGIKYTVINEEDVADAINTTDWVENVAVAPPPPPPPPPDPNPNNVTQPVVGP